VSSLTVTNQVKEQVAGLDKDERGLVISSFSDLMIKMVNTFAQYVKNTKDSSAAKVSLSVRDATKSFQDLKGKAREEIKASSEKNLNAMVDNMVEAFLSEGTLTRTSGSSDAFLELDSFPKAYFSEETGKVWKSKFEERWAAQILNNHVNNFIFTIEGASRIEKIEKYTEEEAALLGKKAVEFVSSPQLLPCGEFAMLKSGAKKIGERLLNLDQRSYTEVLESWGHKRVKEPETNDLLVFDDSVHVYHYIGKGKVQSKYGNANIYCVEEDYAKVVSKCGDKLVIWRAPSP